MSRRESGAGGTGAAVKKYVAAALLGMAVTLIALLIFAALIAGEKLPESLMKTLTHCAAILGAITTGIVSARTAGERVLVNAVAAGAVYLLMVLVLCAFICDDGYGKIIIEKTICALFGSAFGGALCVNRKNKKSSRHRKRVYR